MIKGLEALAKACAPEDEATTPPATSLQLTEEQIDMIAERMIAKLQTTPPAPASQDQEQEPDETPEDPEEGENENDT